MNYKVAILIGSDTDRSLMENSMPYFDYFNINAEIITMSAHRNPDDVGKFSKKARSNGYSIIIGAAGMAAHLAGAIKEFKAGKLEFRADKAGIVHVRFGKASFSEEALLENLKTLQGTIEKNKPSGAKGKFWRSFFITSTMGPSVEVDINELQDLQKEK